ncbi:hypothetical protein BC835DRAFT_1352824 [Cytidiella melzeri]|nr:hypothetical protein BC835DRAFT_1352824 [Cytidiella melzeri]
MSFMSSVTSTSRQSLPVFACQEDTRTTKGLYNSALGRRWVNRSSSNDNSTFNYPPCPPTRLLSVLAPYLFTGSRRTIYWTPD